MTKKKKFANRGKMPKKKMSANEGQMSKKEEIREWRSRVKKRRGSRMEVK